MKVIKTEREFQELIGDIVALKDLKIFQTPTALTNVFVELKDEQYRYDTLLDILNDILNVYFSIEVENIHQYPLSMKMDLVNFLLPSDKFAVKIIKRTFSDDKNAQELEEDMGALRDVITILIVSHEFELSLKWLQAFRKNCINNIKEDSEDIYNVIRDCSQLMEVLTAHIQIVLYPEDNIDKKEHILINPEIAMTLFLEPEDRCNTDIYKMMRQTDSYMAECYHLVSEIMDDLRTKMLS